MAEQTHGSAKRQRVAVVESALANIDVASQLASFLEAKELCQVKATCKALGSVDDDASVNRLSTVDEASRRIYEGASDEEKAVLPRYNGESWIVLYHHLLMLRARLTFDQFVGNYVGYRGGDKAALQGMEPSVAICGNHIMRAGKHWATFTSSTRFETNQYVGVIRPLPGWDKKGLDWFSPGHINFREDLRRERTDRWEGDVHCCYTFLRDQVECYWSDWDGGGPAKFVNWEGDIRSAKIGMLLDLWSGALSVYQNGRMLGTLKDGLAGEYCWTAGFHSQGDVSIQRGYEDTVSR